MAQAERSLKRTVQDASDLAQPASDEIGDRIDGIYQHLYGAFRLSAFERSLSCCLREWPELTGGPKFYSYSSIAGAELHPVRYRDAIADLFRLVQRLRDEKPDWVETHPIEILESLNIVYLIQDYFSEVSQALNDEMSSQALSLCQRIESGEFTSFPAQPEGTVTRARKYDDPYFLLHAQTNAALNGINYLFRSRIPKNQARALVFVEALETLLSRVEPEEHRKGSDRLILLGTLGFHKGRLLTSRGDYEGAQTAFGYSSDAYNELLNQLRRHRDRAESLSEDEAGGSTTARDDLRGAETMALRRAALVSTLGISYISFVNGRITEALVALRSSRGVLKQNAGAIYGAFADILFYVCRRAKDCSDRAVIDEVVEGLEESYRTLEELVPETEYHHRAGVELAAALHDRARASYQHQDRESQRISDHQQALKYLTDATGYAEKAEDGHVRNPHLLAEALTLSSYIRPWLPDASNEEIEYAAADAERAASVATGNTRIRCEAMIAQGIAEFRAYQVEKEPTPRAKENEHLQRAQRYFHEALELNDGRNVRIEGVCYLNLARLCSFAPGSVALAHDHFTRWTQLKDRIEHTYCHDLAREVGKRLSANGPLLVINAEESLSYPEWEQKLREHLINSMLKNLANRIKGQSLDESRLKGLIVDSLISDLEFKRSKAYAFVGERKYYLLTRLRNLRHLPHGPKGD